MFYFLRKKIKEVPATGLIPSPRDGRDFLLSTFMPEVKRIPDELPPPFDLTIFNQGNYPSCVGQSSAAVKQEKEFRERHFETFDGKWIYDECKKTDGMPNIAGTFFREGLKVLQKKGAKPLDKSEFEAQRYKIGSYAQVDDTSFEGLKKAIYVNGAVLAGYRGSNAGWQTAYVRPPRQGESLWGHAVSLVGYTRYYLIGQNSWGKEWGDKGLFYIPSDYVPIEAWAVLTDLPTPEVGETGWVAKKYVLNGKTTTALRLREGAGTEAKIIRVLPMGTEVQQTSAQEITCNGLVWINVRVV